MFPTGIKNPGSWCCSIRLWGGSQGQHTTALNLKTQGRSQLRVRTTALMTRTSNRRRHQHQYQHRRQRQHQRQHRRRRQHQRRQRQHQHQHRRRRRSIALFTAACNVIGSAKPMRPLASHSAKPTLSRTGTGAMTAALLMSALTSV